jgi:hypothetical protein
MWATESHTKKGSVQKDSSGKAAASWTDGAYEGVREHGQGATCLPEAAPAKAGNAAGELFQRSPLLRARELQLPPSLIHHHRNRIAQV